LSKSNFIVRGGADFSAIKKEMDKTQKQFKGFKSVLNTGLKTFGKLTGIALGAKALYEFGKASIKVASDLEEIQNVVDVTFGSMAKDIDEFSKGLIYSFGLGELAAKKYASYMGAMLKSSGISGKAVKEMSMNLTKLTADMASFYNLETEEMFQKLMSGMTGATMPLKQLGINMNITNLEAFALSQGIKKSWKEMSQAEQVMLRYNYLMSVTSDSQGDFARNSWNWAHSLKILNEKGKEFMALFGTGLKEILLPIVWALIDILDVLIEIGKEIGKIYVMITGRKVVAKTNKNIGNSADYAADSENDLAKGIDKATKAAKRALMPFDELNILQSNLNSNGFRNMDMNDINTDFKISDVGDGITDGIRKTQEETNKFYFWFTDKWNSLKQMLSVPIRVPVPIFPPLPSVIYNPNWGLDLPPLKIPVFQPIPIPVYEPEWGLEPPPVPAVDFPPIRNPVYKPNWGLDLPKLPVPIFPPIPVPVYEPKWGLEVPKIPVPVFPPIPLPVYQPEWNLEPPLIPIPVLPALDYIPLRQSVAEMEGWVKTQYQEVLSSIIGFLGNVEGNFLLHKNNMDIITQTIGSVVLKNTKSWLITKSMNVITTLTSIQKAFNNYGLSMTNISKAVGQGILGNFNATWIASAASLGSFFKSSGMGFKEWGLGILQATADVGKGIVNNIVSALKTAYRAIANFAKSTGEKSPGSFSPDTGINTKTVLAGALIGTGVIALTLTAPAWVPYVAGGLAGLAAIPALAKGGITDGPMMALIGDNPGGKEVVSPLDDLMGMIQTAVSESGGNSGDIYLTVKVGEDTLAEKVINNINRQNRINGKTLITI